MFLNSELEQSDRTKNFFALVDDYVGTDFNDLEGMHLVFSFVEPSRFVGQVPVPVTSFKFPSVIRDLFKKDFHVEISREAWAEASRSERRVIVWRGLRACEVQLDEGMAPKIDAVGRIMTRIGKPDIDASFFSEEVLKFGANASLKALTKTLQHLVVKSDAKDAAQKAQGAGVGA